MLDAKTTSEGTHVCLALLTVKSQVPLGYGIQQTNLSSAESRTPTVCIGSMQLVTDKVGQWRTPPPDDLFLENIRLERFHLLRLLGSSSDTSS